MSTRARLTARCHCTMTLVRRYRLDYNVPCSGRLNYCAEFGVMRFPAAQRCRCAHNGQTSVDLHLDVFRSMTSRRQPLPMFVPRGYLLYSEDDCDSIGLPEGWTYIVNCDGVGRKLAFPVLVNQSADF